MKSPMRQTVSEPLITITTEQDGRVIMSIYLSRTNMQNEFLKVSLAPERAAKIGLSLLNHGIGR